MVCTTTSSKQAQELVRPSYRWHAAHVSHSCAYYGVRLCLVQVIKLMASWLPAGKPAIWLASGSVLLLLAPEQSRSRSIFVLLVGMVDVALLHGSMVYSIEMWLCGAHRGAFAWMVRWSHAYSTDCVLATLMTLSWHARAGIQQPPFALLALMCMVLTACKELCKRCSRGFRTSTGSRACYDAYRACMWSDRGHTVRWRRAGPRVVEAGMSFAVNVRAGRTARVQSVV